VVAWAISAEVVMGAKRDAARKNNEISTMRLHEVIHNIIPIWQFAIHPIQPIVSFISQRYVNKIHI
jgi:hypothetical protein